MLKGVSLGCCCASRGVPEPVVGNALRAVGHRDRAALAESKGFECAAHRRVVLVGVAAQVVSVLCRKLEDCPSDAATAHCGHAVNHVVVDIGMPRAIDLCVGLVRPGSERKDGERPSFIGHEEAVSARDVFLSVNSTRVSVGPLCRIPMRLHECAGVLIRALDELKVVRGSESNLHVSMIGPPVGRLVFRVLSPMGDIKWGADLEAALAARPGRRLRG